MAEPDPERLRERHEQEGAGIERYVSCSPWDRRYHQVRFGHVTAALDRELHQGDRFLDVGCGTGEYLDHAAALGADPTGIDISSTHCRRVHAAHPGAHVAQATGTSLPFADRAFDVVLCSEVIEHLPTSQASQCVDELYRVADRAVVVSTPNVRAALRRLARRIGPQQVVQLEVGHINLLTSVQLLGSMSRAGWRLTPVDVRHITPPVVGEGLRVPPRWASGASWVERRADRLMPRAGNSMIVIAHRVERG